MYPFIATFSVKLIYLFLILLAGHVASAQDTLTLTLPQADSLFLQRNLLALAGRFQIEASQAYIQQARLWDNPNLSGEFNLYNSPDRKFFDIGGNGQKAFALQQTIVLAGKRSKRVALAIENVRLTEFQFADLLRSLKFTLRSRFYTLFFLQNTLAMYRQQEDRLVEIIAAFDRQFNKNNVSLRELVRLKALRFQINNDQLELELQLTEAQRDLRNLLQTPAVLKPLVPPLQAGQLVRQSSQPPTVDEAIALALDNRPDVRGAESIVKQSDLNYSLQKSLAVPDMRLGGLFDQNGSYIPRYTALTVAIDLPLLNKNQGNIRAARALSEYNRVLQRNKRLEVENEVRAALQKIQKVNEAFQGIDPQFVDQFFELNQSIFRQFEKRNVSLVEFVDFFQSYLDNTRQLNRIRAERINAFQELNYSVGVDLMK